MPFLMGKDLFLSKDEVLIRTKKLAQALAHTLKNYRGIVGIYADISLEGVLLILSAISLGLKIALCSTRDPKEVNEVWLKSLGCDLCFSSVPQFGLYIGNLETKKCNRSFIEENFSSIIRTSGTVSQKKDVQIGFKAHRASAKAVVEYFSYGPDSIWALMLPLYHVSGLSIIFRSLVNDGGIFIAEEIDEIKYAIDEGFISHISLVPIQYERLVKAKISLNKISHIVIGGEKFTSDLAPNIVSTYGMSETASMVYVNNNNGGVILPHAKVKIGDNKIIRVKGESLFDGYLLDGLLHLPLDKEGYFLTPDVGSIDENKNLIVHYRNDNAIVFLGENIQIGEIEDLLNLHPLIERAYVVPINNSKDLKLIAIIKSVNDVDAINFVEIKEYLQSHLSSLKVPKIYFHWPKDLKVNSKSERLAIKEWLLTKMS